MRHQSTSSLNNLSFSQSHLKLERILEIHSEAGPVLRFQNVSLGGSYIFNYPYRSPIIQSKNLWDRFDSVSHNKLCPGSVRQCTWNKTEVEITNHGTGSDWFRSKHKLTKYGNSVIICSPSSQWKGRYKEFPKQVTLTIKLKPTYIDFGVGR